MLDPRNNLEAGFGNLPIAEWSEDEWSLAPGSSVVVPQDRAAVLRLPVDLFFRRLYVYREVVTSGAGEYVIRARLAFRRNGRIVAELPLAETNVANGSTISERSCATVATTNSTPTGADSVELSLSSRMTGATRAVLLTPCRVAALADELTVDILSIRTDAGSVSNYRVWVGVLSSTSLL